MAGVIYASARGIADTQIYAKGTVTDTVAKLNTFNWAPIDVNTYQAGRIVVSFSTSKYLKILLRRSGGAGLSVNEQNTTFSVYSSADNNTWSTNDSGGSSVGILVASAGGNGSGVVSPVTNGWVFQSNWDREIGTRPNTPCIVDYNIFTGSNGITYFVAEVQYTSRQMANRQNRIRIHARLNGTDYNAIAVQPDVVDAANTTVACIHKQL